MLKQDFLGLLLGEVNARAVFADQNGSSLGRKLHVDFVHVDRRAGIADGAQDAAPVCVGSKHGGLGQGRADDAFRDGFGNVQRFRAGDLAFEQLCRALAVARDAAAEIDGHGIERLHERGEIRALFGDLRIARKAVGQDRHHVVRRRVAVDGDHVEGVGDIR